MPRNMPEGRMGRGAHIWFKDPGLCEKFRKMYEEGNSIRQLVIWADLQGIRTPRGGKFNWTTLSGAIVQAGGTLRNRSEAAYNRMTMSDDAFKTLNPTTRTRLIRLAETWPSIQELDAMARFAAACSARAGKPDEKERWRRISLALGPGKS